MDNFTAAKQKLKAYYLQLGNLAVFLQCQKKEKAFYYANINNSAVNICIYFLSQQKGSDHDEGLVLKRVVASGVSQILQCVKALLDGLKGGMEVAEFLL